MFRAPARPSQVLKQCTSSNKLPLLATLWSIVLCPLLNDIDVQHGKGQVSDPRRAKVSGNGNVKLTQHHQWHNMAHFKLYLKPFFLHPSKQMLYKLQPSGNSLLNSFLCLRLVCRMPSLQTLEVQQKPLRQASKYCSRLNTCWLHFRIEMVVSVFVCWPRSKHCITAWWLSQENSHPQC